MALNPDDCPLKFVPYILQHIFLMSSDERCWTNPAQSTALITVTEWRETQLEQLSPKPGTGEKTDTRSVTVAFSKDRTSNS
jgi:hypothetical protein